MQLTDLNLSTRQLRAFLALAEQRNFTRAAQQCHLSQSAFSALDPLAGRRARRAPVRPQHAQRRAHGRRPPASKRGARALLADFATARRGPRRARGAPARPRRDRGAAFARRRLAAARAGASSGGTIPASSSTSPMCCRKLASSACAPAAPTSRWPPCAPSAPDCAPTPSAPTASTSCAAPDHPLARKRRLALRDLAGRALHPPGAQQQRAPAPRGRDPARER